MFDHRKQISYRDLCIQFLFDFALKCLLGSFTGLNFSARNFPPVFELSVTTLSGEDTISILNDCCYYMNYLYHLHASM